MTDPFPTGPAADASSPTRSAAHRAPIRRVALAALAAALLAGAGVAAGCATASTSPTHSAAADTPSRPAPSSTARRCPPPPTAMDMNSPDAALGQTIGREAGTALAGNAPLTVDAEQVRVLGNAVPPGATVDACTDQITFATTTVSFVIEAAPPTNPDMTFRIAGLVNPTVVVPDNAQVTIEFINTDSDEAHALVVTSAGPPFAFRPAARPAFPGAGAGPIGDPTPAGHGARDLTFTASTPGTYRYLCPMPGHAEMGMQATFTVRGTAGRDAAEGVSTQRCK